MNGVQSFQMMYARHDKIVARAREREAAEAVETNGATFAEALPAKAAPEPARTLAATPARIFEAKRPAVAAPVVAPPATAPVAKAAAVNMSQDQVSALMTAFGAPAETAAPQPAETAPATAIPVAKAPRDLSPDQAALLMQSFGIAGNSTGGLPESAIADEEKKHPVEAAPEAEAATVAADARFYPVAPRAKLDPANAADAYLGAIANMERNLQRYGVK